MSNDFASRIRRIAEALSELKAADPASEKFGAEAHKYELGEPVDEGRLLDFEQAIGVSLPPDYRAFLLGLGDGITKPHECGAAGPGYGLFSVFDEDVERLRREFPAKRSILGVVELREDDPVHAEWSEQFKISRDGVIVLSHYGCGIMAVLPIRGRHAGTVWIDDESCGDLAQFSDHCQFFGEGGDPNLHGKRHVLPKPYSFLDWYEHWVESYLSPDKEYDERPPEYTPGTYVVPHVEWSPPAETPCPECGRPLRTAKAQQCLECGADWHERSC